MARSAYQRLGRIVAGVLVGAVLFVTTLVVVVWYQWQWAEQEVLEDQARQAEIVRGDLEQSRDAGRLEEADVEAIVRRAEGSKLYSVTERSDDVYVVARVGALDRPAFGVPGLDYACFGFTVPASDAPVTMERLSPDEGRWPEECRTSDRT